MSSQKLHFNVAYYLLLINCILLTSCATISNSRTEHITVYTPKPSILVIENDSVKTKKNKAGLDVVRQKKPFEFTVLTDSDKKKITLNYRNSVAFYANIFTNYGIGMLVDRKNPKRYGYPKKIYINAGKGLPIYTTNDWVYKKGDVLLDISFPYVNSFHLVPDGYKAKDNTGFMGFAMGVDYFHSDKQFINFSAGGVSDFFLPFPAPVDFSGEREQMSSTFLTLSNNHVVNRFSFGYGISYSQNTWHLSDYGRRFDTTAVITPIKDPINKTNRALGFVFTYYFKVFGGFTPGIIYRPTFLRFNTADKFKYEHLISLDLAWKIPLN
ncbi:MAG: hypothetical protein JWR50_2643 [Mucilaginibacter sp.]|nr:hypothetical protein [Mucilaginibacter sp.]